MKRLLSIFATFVVALAMISCDKETEIVYNERESVYYMTSMTCMDYKLYREYTYDDEMNLVTITEIFFSDSYAGGEFDSSNASSSDFDTHEVFNITYGTSSATLTDEFGGTIVLIFNDNGYVSKLSKYDAAGEQDYYILYTYSSDGYLKTYEKNEYGYTTLSTCEWTNGNLVSIVDVEETSDGSVTYDKMELVYGSSEMEAVNYDVNRFFVEEEYQLFPSIWFGECSKNISTKCMWYEPKSSESEDWVLMDDNDVSNSYTFDENGCVESYSCSSAYGTSWSTSFTYFVLD